MARSIILAFPSLDVDPQSFKTFDIAPYIEAGVLSWSWWVSETVKSDYRAVYAFFDKLQPHQQQLTHSYYSRAISDSVA